MTAVAALIIFMVGMFAGYVLAALLIESRG